MNNLCHSLEKRQRIPMRKRIPNKLKSMDFKSSKVHQSHLFKEDSHFKEDIVNSAATLLQTFICLKTKYSKFNISCIFVCTFKAFSHI